MSVDPAETLSATQQDRYDVLVTRTARYVRSGAFEIEDCTPDALFGDGTSPSEALVETFQVDVREELERLTATTSDRQSETATQTTTDGAAVDWPALWREVGIDPDDALSMTQLGLAIDISEQTPASKAAASDLVDTARDAGVLLKRRARYKPAQGGDSW